MLRFGILLGLISSTLPFQRAAAICRARPDGSDEGAGAAASSNQACVCFVTTPGQSVADELSTLLVESGTVACVNQVRALLLRIRSTIVHTFTRLRQLGLLAHAQATLLACISRLRLRTD